MLIETSLESRGDNRSVLGNAPKVAYLFLFWWVGAFGRFLEPKNVVRNDIIWAVRTLRMALSGPSIHNWCPPSRRRSDEMIYLSKLILDNNAFENLAFRLSRWVNWESSSTYQIASAVTFFWASISIQHKIGKYARSMSTFRNLRLIPEDSFQDELTLPCQHLSVDDRCANSNFRG